MRLGEGGAREIERLERAVGTPFQSHDEQHGCVASLRKTDAQQYDDTVESGVLWCRFRPQHTHRASLVLEPCVVHGQMLSSLVGG